MHISKCSARLLSCLIIISTCLLAVHTTANAAPGDKPELDNAGCLNCHGDNQKAIKVQDEADAEETRLLRRVDHTGFLKGVHGDMNCTDCHRNIVDSRANHKKSELPDPDCAGCHENLWQSYQEKGVAAEMERMGVVVANIQAYKDSFHAKPTKTGVKASCNDCHHAHEFNVPPRGSVKRTEWHLSIPMVCGSACHDDTLEEYAASVHGKKVLDEHDPKAAVCTDCHTAHAITKTSQDPFQLAITRTCGNCHEEKFESYRDTYHGQINTLGYNHTAKCSDCHGSHQILGVEHPDSTIHPDNRLETCQECHDGEDIPLATASYLSFGPHANSHEFEKYPQVWIAAHFMHGLLLFVFSYFWAHSLLWWYREYKDRKAGRGHVRVRTDELPLHETRQVRRFGPMWRIGHLFFAISVMLLILTGMTLSYAHTAWAPVVVGALGGPGVAGLIHRISAAVMLGIFFIHLIGVSVNIYRSRKTFRWFGPDSLVPNWKDFRDAIGMFKWFVNKGPRPVFDRWTYWEKFDYWAVFWGMAVIGTSGMMLAFPEVTAALFPGWVFNVVMLVHGEEAFLAAVFLFTVHFFNNHFRPDKMPPPDVVMFTGTQSLEEFKREHKLQYERLVASGELEKYLVNVPSRPMLLGSRILGLFLLGCGLALLIIVAIGFFGGYAPD